MRGESFVLILIVFAVCGPSVHWAFHTLSGKIPFLELHPSSVTTMPG